MKPLQKHTKHQKKNDLQREARFKKYWMFGTCEESFCFFKVSPCQGSVSWIYWAEESNAIYFYQHYTLLDLSYLSIYVEDTLKTFSSEDVCLNCFSFSSKYRWEGKFCLVLNLLTCCMLENLSQTLLWSVSYASPGDWRWRADRKAEENKLNKWAKKKKHRSLSKRIYKAKDQQTCRETWKKRSIIKREKIQTEENTISRAATFQSLVGMGTVKWCRRWYKVASLRAVLTVAHKKSNSHSYHTGV